MEPKLLKLCLGCIGLRRINLAFNLALGKKNDEYITSISVTGRLRQYLQNWCVYVIECKDGSLYTGISNNVPARFQAHCSGRGARYTRSHPPEKLLITIDFGTRSAAAQAEYAIKQMSAKEKRSFCEKYANSANELAL